MKTYAYVVFALLALAPCSPTRAESKLKVVATLSTFGSLANEVGGEHVDVSVIASPRYNPHFVEPRPSDVLKLKRADLFIHGGLDLEAWREPLRNAAGNLDVRIGAPGELDLSRYVTLRNVPTGSLSRSQGDIHLFGNPHYWLDPVNGKHIVGAIAEKLATLIPEARETFYARRDEQLRLIEGKIASWRSQAEPHRGRKFIGYHDEWVYLIEFLRLEMQHFIEPKPGIPPSPRHLQDLTHVIRDQRIAAVIQASFYPEDAATFLAQHTDVPTLKLCQNVEELKECASYIAMLDYNVERMLQALKQ